MGSGENGMPKTKKPKQNLVKELYLVIGLLFVLSVAMAVALYKASDANESAKQSAVNVSLGAMEYSFADNKATKRGDTSINNLRLFLERTAQKDIELGCESAHYNVVRHTKDETQLLLSYGCEHPGARMFAVKSGSVWRLISPTNQFDDLGIPSCDHVAQHGISSEIAPVCVKGLSSHDGQFEYLDR
jgi:hypothetical protein